MAGQSSKPQLSKFEREVRDTIVKSSLSGVAAAAMVVTVCSPAGLGGMIGASLASSGVDATANASDNPYEDLPAYPAPLSAEELSHIRGELASSAASLEITRAATDDKIEHVRALAMSDDLVTFSPTPAAAASSVTPDATLRLALSEPASFAETSADAAPVEAYIEQAPAEDETAAAVAAASYAGPQYDASAPYRDPHLELADLLLAHENF